MTGIQVREIGDFSIEDCPMPRPAHGEVLVKVTVTGLCRTDLKIIRVGHRDLVLPRIPGEEVVGEVVEIAAGVTGVTVGQRVYVYPGTSCGKCTACMRGAGNLCVHMRIMGFHRDGGFAEYVTAPAASLISLPGTITDDEAVFMEPLSCCLNALELARIAPGDAIGIWGAGPAGTLLRRASSAMGAEPYIIERDERRRDLVSGHEEPPGFPLDVAVVAVGDKTGYAEAIKCLGPRGRLVIFSGLPRDDASMEVDLNQMHYLEQTMVGAYGCSFRHGVEALEMIAGNRMQVSDMVSHRMPLGALDEALDIVENRSGMKILLYP